MAKIYNKLPIIQWKITNLNITKEHPQKFEANGHIVLREEVKNVFNIGG